jgi:hypothetical protein
MEILDHVREVRALMHEDIEAAMRLWASDLSEFLDEEALGEAAFNPFLADMFLLSEDVERVPKSVRKDRRKIDKLKSMTAHIYAGAPERAARLGHEAHSEGLRAVGMERSAKASPAMKVNAHHEAQQAHMLARNHLGKAGHTQAAELHQRAANFHKERQAMLAAQHGLSVEEKDARIQGKKKPDYSMGFPQEESTIENWISDLDEGEYDDDVKRASKMAAGASEVAKQPHANMSHHETAARLHFIAHGVALAHGHVDLAKKHKEMVVKHRDWAAKAKASA